MLPFRHHLRVNVFNLCAVLACYSLVWADVLVKELLVKV
jgi:hypothetical protein